MGVRATLIRLILGILHLYYVFLIYKYTMYNIPEMTWVPITSTLSAKMAQHQCTPDADGLNVVELIAALFDINPFTLRVALRGIVCFFHTFENN